MPKTPERPLTLRDVSAASGVSEMTVSRVLRGLGDVSDATRARVQEAATRLGYVPNRIAGALASSRVNLVAVVVPSLGNMVFPEVLSGISEGLADTGLQPVIGFTDYLPDREEKVLFEMLSWRPSGVIVAGLEHSAASRAMLDRAGVPVVEIMDVDGEAVDAVVGISHRRAGREMAEAILRAGYRRIGVLGSKMPLDFRARKRMEGFRARLAEARHDAPAHPRRRGGVAHREDAARHAAARDVGRAQVEPAVAVARPQGRVERQDVGDLHREERLARPDGGLGHLASLEHLRSSVPRHHDRVHAVTVALRPRLKSSLELERG